MNIPNRITYSYYDKGCLDENGVATTESMTEFLKGLADYIDNGGFRLGNFAESIAVCLQKYGFDSELGRILIEEQVRQMNRMIGARAMTVLNKNETKP